MGQKPFVMLISTAVEQFCTLIFQEIDVHLFPPSPND